MPETRGINHLGLAVNSPEDTTAFFVETLGWEESGRDESYPRAAVTDGYIRLTLWQVDHALDVSEFDRRKNIGLHHLALEVESNARLTAIAERMRAHPGRRNRVRARTRRRRPRVHMMCREPGGLRIEFLWPGDPNP